MSTAPLPFAKGHGTENDFVILPDPDGALDLTAQLVSALCERRRGIGGDGVLRVARAGALVRSGVLAELPAGVAGDDWFMDYRNADGSLAEMCGNGVRVFAHYCRAAGLVGADEFVVASRAGPRPVTLHSWDDGAAEVTVAMGRARLDGRSTVTIAGRELTGEAIDVGNPHLACVVDGLTPQTLAALDLSAEPVLVAGRFPGGANVEILTPLEPDAAPTGAFASHLRVIERGVGETRSCGTGLVAGAVAALHRLGRAAGVVVMTVPGGTVTVTLRAGQSYLRGPSRLIAHGEVTGGFPGR
ncbi:diaminopimelate epimerase [Gordonia hirsuta DSM 44140 = NBRC 16056]|uniref:Diaminopimelate epimerase n=1 Tax=Gordonia hirsuta DSM 44140 = NBRC 16056 TaxID=1121927 RepID=L7LC36_9ACTN|nr:diaminopimelate epimerase [Gordonia hirsuta]GAC58311.1 diaminopimelate epimerase [Gordonia hirsuta DSM 44140 = NBRC 16056]